MSTTSTPRNTNTLTAWLQKALGVLKVDRHSTTVVHTPIAAARAFIREVCVSAVPKCGTTKTPQANMIAVGKIEAAIQNPSGIPYLYLASTPNTAISEIRPHTGELASVADFSVLQELKLVDLRNPKGTVSPFILGDENEIALLRGDIEFLKHLGNELTRPVRPQAAAIEYIPSQYLCEFIKKCGYDGVLYKSSVGDGVNLALFKPDLVHAGTVKQHRVARVSVQIDS